MASNPMQRKTRNSFLLGTVVTLLITGVIIVLLLLQVKQKQEQIDAEKAARRMVYVLTQDVKAGQVLTQDMFASRSIHQDSIPSDATSVPSVIDSWFLQTKEGEPVYTDDLGLYLYLDRSGADQVSDTIIEVYENTGAQFIDSNGNTVATGDNYVMAGGMTEKVTSLSETKVDDYGMFFVDKQGNDKEVRVYQEALTDEYYTLKIDTNSINTAGSVVRVKEYIDIKDVPVLAKVDMKANTVVTEQLVVQSDERITDDTRQEQYNMITLPIDLMTGDYVDIRLKMPSGQNFVVLSKLQVEIPMNADGTYISDTIKVNLREDEILSMSSAIGEAYGVNGSELYAVKYVDPAMQAESYPTYTPNEAVTQQLGLDLNNDGILDNPNLVENAKQLLATRYSNAAKAARNQYLQQAVENQENYLQNIESSVNENLGTSMTSRKKYLESLNY